MDLNFWRYQAGAVHGDERVYERACCDGEGAEGLEELPIPAIRARIAEGFSAWTALDENSYAHEPQLSARFDAWTER